MQGTIFFFFGTPVTCHFGADWTQGHDGTKKFKKGWKYIWSGDIIFGRRIRRHDAAEMDTQVHGNMAALQNESGPPFSSCPGAYFGGGGDRQPKEGEEGAKRLDGQRDPGGCAACAEWMQALGWQAGPCIARHGARRGLFPSHFQLRAPHALPSLPFAERDNIAASCSFHSPSRASSLFPPLLIPSFGLDTRSRRPRPAPLHSFWPFHILYYLIHRSVTRRSRCT